MIRAVLFDLGGVPLTSPFALRALGVAAREGAFLDDLGGDLEPRRARWA